MLNAICRSLEVVIKVTNVLVNFPREGNAPSFYELFIAVVCTVVSSAALGYCYSWPNFKDIGCTWMHLKVKVLQIHIRCSWFTCQIKLARLFNRPPLRSQNKINRPWRYQNRLLREKIQDNRPLKGQSYLVCACTRANHARYLTVIASAMSFRSQHPWPRSLWNAKQKTGKLLAFCPKLSAS